MNLNKNAQYNPQQSGKIEGIDFFLELKDENDQPGDIETRYAIIIKQDNVFYESPCAKVSGHKKWHGFISNGLKQKDFKRIGRLTPSQPNNHPNFSSSGELLQFGYVIHCSSSAGVLSATSAINNWKIVVSHRETLSPVDTEIRQRLLSEAQERQRLERHIAEQRVKAEQELRELKLRAEEDKKKLKDAEEQMLELSASLGSFGRHSCMLGVKQTEPEAILTAAGLLGNKVHLSPSLNLNIRG